jgi:hypothetical protein
LPEYLVVDQLPKQRAAAAKPKTALREVPVVPVVPEKVKHNIEQTVV